MLRHLRQPQQKPIEREVGDLQKSQDHPFPGEICSISGIIKQKKLFLFY